MVDLLKNRVIGHLITCKVGFHVWQVDKLIDWFIEKLIDWHLITDLLTIFWHTERWLIDGFVYLMIFFIPGWSNDLLDKNWMTDWLIRSSTDWLSQSESLIKWKADWLADWIINWLTEGLMGLILLQPNPTKGKMRIHCLENVDKSLMFLNEQRVHLENVGAHDIVDGNPRLTLGLIWTIILRFQV